MRGGAIEDRRQRRQVDFVVHMPFRGPAQARQRQPARAFSHAPEAQIGRIARIAPQRGLVGAGRAAARMDEAIGEPRPGCDLDQQVGDADSRQQVRSSLRSGMLSFRVGSLLPERGEADQEADALDHGRG